MNQQTTAIRDEYLIHITAQQTSGLSTAAYCKLHNLNLNKLYHYKSYKYSESKKKIKTDSSFAPVKIQSSENSFKKLSQPAAELLSVSSVIDPEWLAKFIFTLSRCK